jgi:hypothetical protein
VVGYPGRVMTLSPYGEKLNRATKDLFVAWGALKETWRDAKAEEFYATYLDELSPAVTSVTLVIDELDHILHRIRQDCE